MHFYVTGYKFGMMVLVSLSFSRCVNFVGRGQVLVLVLNLLVLVLVLKAVVLVLVLKGLVLITTLFMTESLTCGLTAYCLETVISSCHNACMEYRTTFTFFISVLQIF